MESILSSHFIDKNSAKVTEAGLKTDPYANCGQKNPYPSVVVLKMISALSLYTKQKKEVALLKLHLHCSILNVMIEDGSKCSYR